MSSECVRKHRPLSPRIPICIQVKMYTHTHTHTKTLHNTSEQMRETHNNHTTHAFTFCMCIFLETRTRCCMRVCVCARRRACCAYRNVRAARRTLAPWSCVCDRTLASGELCIQRRRGRDRSFSDRSAWRRRWREMRGARPSRDHQTPRALRIGVWYMQTRVIGSLKPK